MGLSDVTLSAMNQFATNGFARKNPAPNSQKSYRNHIKQFEEFLHTKGKTASDGTVTEEDVQDYIAQIQTKFSPNTVCCRVGAIKSYFGWLKSQGNLTHVPQIKSLTHSPAQRVDVTEEEIEELLKQMPPTKLRYVRDAAMISLMAYRGFTTEEVVNMNVGDANFEGNIIRHRGIWRQMKKASGSILAYAQAKLDLGINQKEDKPFFLNKNGERISARSLRRHFNIYFDAAALKRQFSTRDLCMSKSKTVHRVPQLVTG